MAGTPAPAPEEKPAPSWFGSIIKDTVKAVLIEVLPEFGLKRETVVDPAEKERFEKFYADRKAAETAAAAKPTAPSPFDLFKPKSA